MAAQGASLPPLPVYGPRFPMQQTYTFLNYGQFVTDVNITVEDAIKKCYIGLDSAQKTLAMRS